jgi:hypothetical protein
MELVAAMHYERFARLIATGTLIVSASWACARPVAPVVVPERAPQDSPCTVAAAPPSAPETLVVALPPARSSGFSAPALFDALRFEAELTRETLVGVDCTGAIVPELAESWEIDSARNRWTFTLKDGASLTNGDPLTSREVFAAWHATDLDSLQAAVRESLVALDARRVRLTLPAGHARLLGSSRLAVLERAPVDVPDDASISARVAGLAAPRLGRMASGAPAVIYGAISPATDPRDLVDRGVDILFTEDPAAARYAAARSEYSVHELPPQRTYALAIPSSSSRDESLDFDLDDVESLVRDVVRVPARPASRPPWWKDFATCPMSPGVESSAQPTLPRVAYREDDPVARAIAERLVSLASRSTEGPLQSMVQSSGGGTLAAEALSPGEFLGALREGSRAAFVVSTPARPLAVCQAFANLVAAVPWAFREGVRGGGLVPLIDAGAWAIVRRGSVGLAATWDGTPILSTSAVSGSAP